MVSNGSPSWTAVTDSTYSATVNLQSDLTGQGYLANQVQVGHRVFTPTEQLYEVTAVTSTTFSSATITVVERSNQYVTTNSAPSGQVMVFDPDGREKIPDIPFGSTGATATMNAAVVTYNARISDSGGALPDDDVFYYADNTLGADYSLPLDTLLKYDHLYIHLRSDPADPAVLTLPSPGSGDGRAKTIVASFGGQEANPGFGIVTASNALDVKLHNCREPGTSFGPDTLVTTNTDQRFAVYRTVGNANDYHRECTNLFDENGNPVEPGDTIKSPGITYETQTVGGAGFDLAYQGEGVTIANPSSGNYTITPDYGTDFFWVTVTGDNSTLNASQEMIIDFDNSTNNAARRFIVQLYDDNNDGLVDQQTTSTNHTQSVSTNTTTLTLPGLNGFGATGFKIELR